MHDTPKMLKGKNQHPTNCQMNEQNLLNNDITKWNAPSSIHPSCKIDSHISSSFDYL